LRGEHLSASPRFVNQFLSEVLLSLINQPATRFPLGWRGVETIRFSPYVNQFLSEVLPSLINRPATRFPLGWRGVETILFPPHVNRFSKKFSIALGEIFSNEPEG
jgi:hypothetical protein